MSKIRLARISIGIALLVILIAISVTKGNPFEVLQSPGWALAFGAVFTAEDNRLTVLKFHIIYWVINIGFWSLISFGILFAAVRCDCDQAFANTP